MSEGTEMTERGRVDSVAQENTPPDSISTLKVSRKKKSDGDIDKDKLRYITRQELMMLSKRVERKLYAGRMYRDLVLYAVFFATFLAIVFLGKDLLAGYSMESAIKNNFLNEEFRLEDSPNAVKTWKDIAAPHEWWQWLKGPVLNGFDQTGTSFVSVIGADVLVGSVRLRQKRVNADSCSVDQSIATVFGERCFAAYRTSIESKTPYGPVDDPELWEWKSDNSPSVFGVVGTYESGGFVADLSHDLVRAAREVQFLQDAGWLDEGTRAISVVINLYNVNLNYWYSCAFFTEFPSGGSAIVSSNFRSFKLNMYVTPVDALRGVLEVLFLVCLIFVSFKTVREIFLHKFKHRRSVVLWFVSAWNAFDIVNKCMLWIAVIWYIVFLLRLDHFVTSISDIQREGDFVEAENLGYLYVQLYNFCACAIIVGTMVFFKYLTVNTRMSLLWLTLSRAAGDLLAFFVFFFIVFIGFVLSAHLLFGTSLAEYRDLGNALFTSFVLLVGQVEYEDLVNRGNRYLAPLWFLFYVISVCFILLNVFLAIINNAYAYVHVRAQDTLTISDSIRRTMNKLQRRAHGLMSAKQYNKQLGYRETGELLRALVHRTALLNIDVLSADQLVRLCDAPQEVVQRLHWTLAKYMQDQEEDAARTGEMLAEKQAEAYNAAAQMGSLQPAMSPQAALDQVSENLRSLEEKVALLSSRPLRNPGLYSMDSALPPRRMSSAHETEIQVPPRPSTVTVGRTARDTLRRKKD